MRFLSLLHLVLCSLQGLGTGAVVLQRSKTSTPSWSIPPVLAASIPRGQQCFRLCRRWLSGRMCCRCAYARAFAPSRVGFRARREAPLYVQGSSAFSNLEVSSVQWPFSQTQDVRAGVFVAAATARRTRGSLFSAVFSRTLLDQLASRSRRGKLETSTQS